MEDNNKADNNEEDNDEEDSDKEDKDKEDNNKESNHKGDNDKGDKDKEDNEKGRQRQWRRRTKSIAITLVGWAPISLGSATAMFSKNINFTIQYIPFIWQIAVLMIFLQLKIGNGTSSLYFCTHSHPPSPPSPVPTQHNDMWHPKYL